MINRNAGFSLIELMVVLSLLGMTILWVPGSLKPLYERSSLHTTAQQAIAQLHDCSLRARQEQTTLEASFGPDTDGSTDCHFHPLARSSSTIVLERPLLFYPDGTSNGQSLAVVHDGQTLILRVDRLTSRVSQRQLKSQ